MERDAVVTQCNAASRNGFRQNDALAAMDNKIYAPVLRFPFFRRVLRNRMVFTIAGRRIFHRGQRRIFNAILYDADGARGGKIPIALKAGAPYRNVIGMPFDLNQTDCLIILIKERHDGVKQGDRLFPYLVMAGIK